VPVWIEASGLLDRAESVRIGMRPRLPAAGRLGRLWKAPWREGGFEMMLTEEQRQALGEVLTNKLAAMCPESGLSRGPVAPDWFDSRNVDEVLDVIEQTLARGVETSHGGQP
jgi:hypothetical protein